MSKWKLHTPRGTMYKELWAYKGIFGLGGKLYIAELSQTLIGCRENISIMDGALHFIDVLNNREGSKSLTNQLQEFLKDEQA